MYSSSPITIKLQSDGSIQESGFSIEYSASAGMFYVGLPNIDRFIIFLRIQIQLDYYCEILFLLDIEDPCWLQDRYLLGYATGTKIAFSSLANAKSKCITGNHI